MPYKKNLSCNLSSSLAARFMCCENNPVYAGFVKTCINAVKIQIKEVH